ncbi:hypothetical protein V8E54_001794 [Elaphomyces granulatus]
MASKDVKKACFHEILLRINTSDYTNKYQMKDYSIPTVSVILVEWTKSGAKKLLNFDEALLGWIIYTANQAFTCVESQYFKDLIQAAGRTTKLLHSVNLKGTTQSIDETATTVAVTLDGWKNQNKHAFISINATWCSSDFKVYLSRHCTDHW